MKKLLSIKNKDETHAFKKSEVAEITSELVHQQVNLLKQDKHSDALFEAVTHTFYDIIEDTDKSLKNSFSTTETIEKLNDFNVFEKTLGF